MLQIDGQFGEGGGQIVRTALGLSMLTATPFRIDEIRAGRKRPGLLRQHLTAVEAAQRICSAKVTGAHLGSRALTFEPGTVSPGDYYIAMPTAGSTTLVLQAVLPALLLARGPSSLTIVGGTHNPAAPPFPFLQQVFLPLLARMGVVVHAELQRPGFFPAGGGRIRILIEPASQLQPLHLLRRGAPQSRMAKALVAGLPPGVGRRELEVLSRRLKLAEHELQLESVPDSAGPGNVAFVSLAFEQVTELCVGFGERGKPAERVASDVVHAVKEYLRHDAPVGRHLADQLLLPMAIAGSGSYRTVPLSQHTKTNIHTVQQFLPVPVTVSGDAQAPLIEFGGT